jgi:hypothetical protein
MELGFLMEQLVGLRQQAHNIARQLSELMAQIQQEAEEEPTTTKTRRTFGQKEE